jgi:cyclohexanecarboxylate-CoA ligase
MIDVRPAIPPVRYPLRSTPALRARYAGVWPGRTILDFANDYADRKAGLIAVVDGSRCMSFGELMSQVGAMAAALESHGVSAGDVVSFQLPNRLEALVLHLACVRIGAVVNPVIPIYRDRELAHILADAATRLLVIPCVYRGFDYAHMVRRMLSTDRMQIIPIMICGTGGEERAGDFLRYDVELKLHSGATPSGRLADPDALSYLLYTSGTEAAPKGVEHTQNTVLFDLLATIDQNSITEQDVIFAPSPVTHITGLLYGLLLPFILGNRVCLLDRWNAREAARIIEQQRCTWTAGATPFLRDLLYDADAAAHSIASLRTFRCGGADVAPALILEAQHRGLAAYRSYGSTEHPTVSGMLGASEEKSTMTDGRVHPHVEIRCADPDDATRTLQPGEKGEICTRGPDQSFGYHQTGLNETAFDAAGWFHTGDLGRIDAEGFVTITGRKKDIIIRKGENISAKEIEDVIAAHPRVADVAVIGLPDAERGERVCAVVIARDSESFSFADMTSVLDAAGVAKQKYPEQLVLRSEFPTTASGKIRKAVLREAIMISQGGPIG